MSRKIASLATTALMLFSALSPASAGGRAVECYEPHHTPPVYGTVKEHVQVNPAYSRVDSVPAIIGTRNRAVLLSPERVAYETVPAVVRTHYRTVKVSDGGMGWEWRVINGRRVLCKVQLGAQYRKVAETVVVRAAYQRQVIIPAVYSHEVEQVLVQPEEEWTVNAPASYEIVKRRVVLSDGSTSWQRVRIPKHCG